MILWFLGSLLLAMSLIAWAAAGLAKLMSASSAAARHAMWVGTTAAMVATPATWLVLGGLWSIPVHQDSVFPNAASTARLTTLLIELIWTCGAALVTTAVIASAIRTRRNARLSRSHGPAGGEWSLVTDEARHVIGVGRPVLILESTSEAAPITWGFRRPVIVLPSSARDWSAGRRWAVLLHELAHIRRRDYLVELFLLASTIAYWFHPAIWWAARRVREEREAACDDLVLAAGIPPIDYAEHLVEIARGIVRERRVAIVGLDMTRPSAIVARVARILDHRATQNRRQHAGAVLVSTFLAALLLGAAVPRARPLAARATKANCDCAAKRRARAQAAAAGQARATPKLQRFGN